ncbi:hypothetical protein LCGC14_3062970, partial [marine sediment metagenome]
MINMGMKSYSSRLTASINGKGVLDIDTVKGCALGTSAHQNGGCYGLCYANKIATRYGYRFNESVSREVTKGDRVHIENTVKRYNGSWFRIGTMGDPCHNWELTLEVCEWLRKIKTPVIVTKHWNPLSDLHLQRLARYGAVVNTSISALDTLPERIYRLNQFKRIKKANIKSVLRVVSAKFGQTSWGQRLSSIQDRLLKNEPIIDNPLRIAASDKRVESGDILIENRKIKGLDGDISVAKHNAYVGPCNICPDQCGVDFKKIRIGGYKMAKKVQTDISPGEYGYKAAHQIDMFTDTIEFEYVKSVIGSGYEEAVAKLAIEDKVAYRAARK